jgi:hypothetical protein
MIYLLKKDDYERSDGKLIWNKFGVFPKLIFFKGHEE